MKVKLQIKGAARKSFVVALAAAAVVLCTAGMASANVFGPNNGGSGTGYAFCDHVGHRIVFSFYAHPETRVEADDSYTGISTSGLRTVVVPEWIEVRAYVKRSGGRWMFVRTNRALLNRVGSTAVMNVSMPASAGSYWEARFYTRVAYPNGQWSNWVGENAVTTMSYSGSVAAQYGYCLT
jgi:hypothetical protein